MHAQVKIVRICYTCSKCGLVAPYEEQPCPLCASRVERHQLVEENAGLRRDMDARIDDWLAQYHCCNGFECGCQGVTRLQWILFERQAEQRIGHPRDETL